MSRRQSAVPGNMTIPPDYWLTLYTNPHKEYSVRNVLIDKGYTVFLPEERNRTQRRDRRPARPFFPHYLFTRWPGDSSRYEELQWIPGLRRIVSFGNRPALVPQSVIDEIKSELSEREVSRLHDFDHGQRVNIIEGPFRGIEAVFDRDLTGSERVRILLDVVGQAQVHMDIHIEDLGTVE